MLQDQIFPIDFSGGINTKTDPKKVAPGEFLLVQDGVFTQIDQVRKRNGYTQLPTTIANGGGNLLSPRMISTYQNQLTCQDSGIFYSFSTNLQAWENVGNHTSIDFSEKSIFRQGAINGITDCVVFSNYTAYTYSDTTSGSYLSIADNTTGVRVLASTRLPSIALSQSFSVDARVVLLTSTSIAVFYTDGNDLAYRIATVSGSTVALTGHIVLTTVAPSGYAAGTSACFDVVTTGAGCYVSVRTQGGSASQVTFQLDSFGAVINTASVPLSSGGCDSAVSLNYNSSTNLVWLIYGDQTGTGTALRYSLSYIIYSATLTVVLSSTPLIANSLLSFGLVAGMFSNTALTTYITQQTQDSTGGAPYVATPSIYSIYGYTLTAGGTVFPLGVQFTGVNVASRVFFHNGSPYLMAFYQGPYVVTGGAPVPFFVQYTYFTLDLTLKCAVARFAAGTAATATSGFNLNLLNQQGYFPTAWLSCPNVCSIDSDTYVFLAPKAIPGVPSTLTRPGGVVAVDNENAGATAFTLSFNTPRVYNSFSAGQLDILNGALISAYDGETCSEWGFHLAPEVYFIDGPVTGIGGAIAAGTYLYAAVWEWIDGNGNLHQSAPSQEASVTVAGGGGGAFHVRITNPYLSGKTGVTCVLYRTLSGGSIFYRVTQVPGYITGSTTTAVGVDYVDIYADTVIQNNQNLYTTGGVSENDPSPPSLVLEPRFNRLWMVDAEDTNTLWYTKIFNPGDGLAPSNFNVTEIQPTQGNIVGIKSMDDKMIVFKDSGILWFSGDGANDSGTNSSLSQPQNLPTGSGLSQVGSLVLVPNGIIYQTNKGIFLLDRGMSSHYADQMFNGAAVEAFSQNAIYDARIIPNTTQVRFLCTTGTSLHYDYMFNKWSVFTNHLGYRSDIWENTYVYLRTNGTIYQENATTFLDNTSSYPLTLKTSNIAIAGLQGFQRLRHGLVLGDHAEPNTSSGHGVLVSTANNFSTTYTPHNPFMFTGLSTSTPFQFRQFITQQKTDAISFLIQEIVTGASGEYIDFTGMSLNCGVKKGLHKVSSAFSVG